MEIKEYYTPPNLAKFLINQIDITPNIIVDICAGTWNLLNSAKSRWPNAELLGVDIKNISSKSIIEDGRIFAIKSKKENKFYDLVLANPPFRKEKITPDILEGIKELIKEPFNKHIYHRLECTMLMANLSIVKQGGILAAIVPISIINSEKNKALRKFISKDFYLEKIIILPFNVFGKEIQTAIIILRKNDLKFPTVLYRAESINDEYNLKHLCDLSPKKVKGGNWWIIEEPNLEYQIDFSIIRNKISCNVFQKNNQGVPVIHSTSIKNNHLIDFKYIKEAPSNRTFVEKGDILIVRIGRKCGEFKLIENNQKALTSDCVLIIRPHTHVSRKRILFRLNSIKKENLIKGITTKYITQKDLSVFFLKNKYVNGEE